MKKILFNDNYGLTAAVLDGRKTMTRRFLNVPKRFHGVDAPQLEFHKNAKGLYFDCVLIDYNDHELGQLPLPYEVGEIVAIAQSYHTLNKSGSVAPEWCEHTCESSAGYRNKMFVRADFMPNRIQMTDLWFEHLQDISNEDCLREGVEKWMDCFIVTGIIERGKNNVCFETPRQAFAALIDKVSGRGTWEKNPWVFAYSFKLMQ